MNAPDNPYPENTLPSFEQAVAEGADWIELDVQHTADRALVVIHDETVNRTTDGTGCVGDLSLAEIQALDAGFGTSLQGTGVQVPTLDAVLATIPVPLNIEIKIYDGGACPPSDRSALAEDVVAAVAADPAGRQVLVSSFDRDVLLEVQTRDGTIPLGLLSLDPTDYELAAAHGFAYFNPLGNFLSAEDVAAVHHAGLRLAAWTLDDPELMADLVDYGVDMIITNAPDAYTALRQAHCGD